MKVVVLLVALAACGRFGFDAHAGDGDGGGGDDAGDDAGGTFAPQWVRQLGPSAGSVFVAGSGGEVVAAKNYTTSLAVEGATFTGKSPFGSIAVVRYDAAGTILATTSLDATSSCQLRGFGMLGTEALAVGYTSGGTTDPTYGVCSIATGRQAPIEIAVARDGGQRLVAHWVSSGMNAQAWRTTVLSDGSLAMSGVYSGGLDVGGMALPAAGFDPNAFVTRFADGGAPVWAKGLAAGVGIQGGPLSASDGEVCMLGAFSGSVTVFGVALPFAGITDRFLARLDASGNAKWVRAIGTSADEPAFGRGSVVALADGSCWMSAEVDADITLDAFPLPVADGTGIVALFGPGGSVVTALRTPNAAQLIGVGSALVGAMDIDAPYTLGGVPYVPDGRDVLVGELVSNSPVVFGVIGGAGDQSVSTLSSAGPDALAVGVVSTGELAFAGTTFDTGASTVDAVAVFGF